MPNYTSVVTLCDSITIGSDVCHIIHLLSLCDSITIQSLATRYYFNSFYFMSMTVSGQDMKEDGWRMNFEEKGSFRTRAGSGYWQMKF